MIKLISGYLRLDCHTPQKDGSWINSRADINPSFISSVSEVIDIPEGCNQMIVITMSGGNGFWVIATLDELQEILKRIEAKKSSDRLKTMELVDLAKRELGGTGGEL
jgi:hypothetical protein